MLFWTQNHLNKLESTDWYGSNHPNWQIPTNQPWNAILAKSRRKVQRRVLMWIFQHRLLARQSTYGSIFRLKAFKLRSENTQFVLESKVDSKESV